MKKLLMLLFILSLSFTFVACNEDIEIDQYESIYPEVEKEVEEDDKFYVIQPDYEGALYDFMMENYYQNSVNMNFKVAAAIRSNCESFYNRSRDFMIELDVYNQMHEKYVYYFAGLMYIKWNSDHTYLSDAMREEFKSQADLLDYITNNYLAEDGPNGDIVLKMKSYVPELNPLG